MSFGKITWNQNTEKKQDHGSWKHSFIVNLKTFTYTLEKMMKEDLVVPIMS